MIFSQCQRQRLHRIQVTQVNERCLIHFLGLGSERMQVRTKKISKHCAGSRQTSLPHSHPLERYQLIVYLGPTNSPAPPRLTSMLPALDLSSNSNSSLGMLASNDDWYSQQGLLVESITPPLPTRNDHSFVFMSPSEQVQQTNAVTIVTRRAYIYPSFLTYLLHSLHHFTHRSIFYIDDPLNNTSLPSTSTSITYLICLDQFHPTIQQMLDNTVLHNLNAHINYCFLLLNAPSQRLISHVYETVMDKRLVLVLHYHSTFDDAPLLLCSGARETFEMVRGSVLQCLCVKVKYIDAPTNNDEQMYSSYCISSIMQSSNVLHQFVQEQIQQTVREHFGQDLLTHHSDVIAELFPSTPTTKASHGNTLLEFVQHERTETLENPSKQAQRMNELFENATAKTQASAPICEYYLNHVLDNHQ